MCVCGETGTCVHTVRMCFSENYSQIKERVCFSLQVAENGFHGIDLADM